MPFAPRGLLLGLINVDGLTPSKRAAARISVALASNQKGYALVETFEVAGDPVRDEGTYAAIEDLANQIDTQSILVTDDVDLDRVHEIAARVRLVVLTLDLQLDGHLEFIE